jgi:hypothetical protein
LTLPAGQSRWLLSKVHLERNLDRRVIRLRGAVVDISSRRRLDLLLGGNSMISVPRSRCSTSACLNAAAMKRRRRYAGRRMAAR